MKNDSSIMNLSKDNLNHENVRLQTFKNWKHNFIQPNHLAKTGFYFIGPQHDNVKCYFCKVEISCWEQDDDIVSEHIRWSQNCPLLRRRDTNNVPNNVCELNKLLPSAVYDVSGPCGVINVSNIESFKIIRKSETNKLKKPTHIEYAIESVRLASFKYWPRTMKQKPHDLSDAGFFYSQRSDAVKCFSCGGGLRDWNENDIPWEQHAIWFNKCEYLKLIKGQKYIDYILVKNKFQNETECYTSDNEEYGSSEQQIKLETKFSNLTVSTLPSTNNSSYNNSEKKLCNLGPCRICYTDEINAAFFPCGHTLTCVKCASSVTTCPMCRTTIESVLRIYFS